MNRHTLKTRRYRKAHPNYNRKYMEAWYKKHPGYRVKRTKDYQAKLKEKQMPTGRRLTEAQVKEIRELLSVGIAVKAISKKMGVSESPITRIKRNPRIKGVPPTDPQAAKPVATPQASIASSDAAEVPEKQVSKYNQFEPKIMELKSKGMGVKAVADELGIPYTSVNYYFYGKRRYSKGKRKVSKIKSTEMESTNGKHPLDTRFLVGFACAELERTLAAISERLGVSPSLVRQGFSRFLGSTPLRS